MFKLITDREQSHVDRRSMLAAKGWNGMTEAERAEWTGDILSPDLAGYTDAVNLLPNDNYYASSVDLKIRRESITATSLIDGSYNYAVVIVGNASNYVDKTLTLSVDHIHVIGDGTPLLAAYWHDENGFETAGAFLTSTGSLTFNTGSNPENRAYLAIYIYASSDGAAKAGDSIQYHGVMLEAGDVRHDYVPYESTLPTAVRKGSYNYSDLNRVERTVEEISEILILGLTTKTDWAMWDVPTQKDMNRFLGNIRKIRSVNVGKIGTPDAPESMAKLDYSKANDIEKILEDVVKNTKYMFFAGDLFSGEV